MSPTDRSGRRAAAARALRLAGALLLVVGVVLGYANRVVFRSEPFAARSADALADPRVSGFVAERVADQVIERNRDLLAFRPVIVGAARLVVASDAFRALFRRAAASAHAVALSSGAETVYMSVPDLAVLLNSALSHAQPELAAKLPPAVQAQLGEDVQRALGAGALRFLQLAHRLRFLVLSCLVLGRGTAVRLRRAAARQAARAARHRLRRRGRRHRAVPAAAGARPAAHDPHRRGRPAARGARRVGRLRRPAPQLGARPLGDGRRPERRRVLAREPRRGRGGRAPQLALAPAARRPARRRARPLGRADGLRRARGAPPLGCSCVSSRW